MVIGNFAVRSETSDREPFGGSCCIDTGNQYTTPQNQSLRFITSHALYSNLDKTKR
jgi:hypothetical protein